MDEFIKDRNETFASMDEDKIKAYCVKYGIEIPKDKDVFWVSVHKTVCNLFLLNNDSPITKEQYDKSYDWLISHGYTPLISE